LMKAGWRGATINFFLAAIVVLATFPLAHAATVDISITEDRATFDANISVNLTALPRSECDWYKGMWKTWQNAVMRSGMIDAFAKHLEKYLRSLDMEKATVEELAIDFTLSERWRTYPVYPVSVSNVTGKLVSGSLENLTLIDNVTMRFESLNSTNTMYIVVDMNITLPDWVPLDKLVNFTLAVTGNLSKVVSEEASINIYNYSSGSYDALSPDALNVTTSTTVELNVTDTEHYIKDRTVMLRINVTDVQSYPSTLVNLDLDAVELKFKYFTMTIQVKLHLAISGISEFDWTRGERRINAKFRWMNPEGTLSYGGIAFNPARLFFINFRAFGVPLEEWSRSFNGTHTTFTYTVSKMTVYTHGGFSITIDPTETITVEGEATASGDTIVVKEVAVPPTYIYIGLAIVVIVIAAFIIAAWRGAKHAISEELPQRRFVRRRSP